MIPTDPSVGNLSQNQLILRTPSTLSAVPDKKLARLKSLKLLFPLSKTSFFLRLVLSPRIDGKLCIKAHWLKCRAPVNTSPIGQGLTFYFLIG